MLNGNYLNSNKDILLIIKLAKSLYNEYVSNQIFIGMCGCICDAIYSFCKIRINYEDIKTIIHEFNIYTFIKLDAYCGNDNDYWWDINNTEVRNKAFDILISIYENKLKQI